MTAVPMAQAPADLAALADLRTTGEAVVRVVDLAEGS